MDNLTRLTVDELAETFDGSDADGPRKGAILHIRYLCDKIVKLETEIDVKANRILALEKALDLSIATLKDQEEFLDSVGKSLQKG